ncbi:hypothetical protein BSKO_05207 [Bryopsis sp. KO-2023]|nr:hypothetical protein BSKO_05207 [Bryopsis sp. KO-2023]
MRVNGGPMRVVRNLLLVYGCFTVLLFVFLGARRPAVGLVSRRLRSGFSGEPNKSSALDVSRVSRSCKRVGVGGSGKRILVTGAAGFIGFHTAKAFFENGEGVVGFDNFNDYYPVSLKRARAEELEILGVHVVDGELTDTSLLKQVVKLCGVTHIVHLAAQAGVRYARQEPMTYIDRNIKGSVSLFEVASWAKPSPQIIYASSSSVYGGNKKVPFSEEDRVDDPVSLYAATKRSVELTANVYHKLHHLSVTGLRFFTVYGPWGRPDMAYFAFTRKIMKGQPVTIFMDKTGGELARDFTYIDDIVSGIVGAVNSSQPSQEGVAENRLFNLGNTNPVTVSDFVSKLEGALRQSAIRKQVPLGNTGDVLFTHANISAAHGAFGYTPQVSLEEGLKLFALWFYDYYGPRGDNLREDEKHYVPL